MIRFFDIADHDGWRAILENRGLDIAQPEVCALGGISENGSAKVCHRSGGIVLLRAE